MSVINIILPLLAIALLGYTCLAKGFLNKNQLDGLNKVTFTLVIPAFLFTSMATADFGNALSLDFFLSFYLPIIVVYIFSGIAFYWLKRFQLKATTIAPSVSLANVGVLSLTSCYSNTIIVGLPVLISAFGEQVTAPIFLLISFHSALLFTITTVQGAYGQATQTNKQNDLIASIITNVVANPLTVSLALGLTVNLCDTPLPNALMATLQILGKPAMMLALFVLGASLYFYKIRNQVLYVFVSVSLKLLILPLIALWLAKYVFELDTLLTSIVVILLASPTGINAYLIACNQKCEQDTVANTVVISTLWATITIPLWLHALS